MTPEQIRGFQFLNVNHLGQPLDVDGILGRQTAWAASVAKLTPRRQMAIRRASALLSVVERTGHNDHPAIDYLLSRCGVTSRAAWCAAAADWCVDGPCIAGAVALGKNFSTTCQPFGGDLYWFRTGPWQGHIGVAIAGDEDTILGIEGNRLNHGDLVRRLKVDLEFSSIDLGDVAVLPPLPVPSSFPVTKTVNRTEGTR